MNMEPLWCERRERVGGLIPVTGVELISDKDKNRPRPVDSDVERIAAPLLTPVKAAMPFSKRHLRPPLSPCLCLSK